MYAITKNIWEHVSVGYIYQHKYRYSLLKWILLPVQVKVRVIAGAFWVFRGFHIGIAKKLKNKSSIDFIIIGGAGGIVGLFLFFFQLRKEA